MYHKNNSNYSYSPSRKPNTINYHSSRRNYVNPIDNNYTSSYLVRKGPKKLEEPTKDYNFEEYFQYLPSHLYSRYYNSHKFLNQGKRFFPNLRLNLNRGIIKPTSSQASSIVSTPSSVVQSRSPSPSQFSPLSRPTSPHFNYDHYELADGINLSRAKSPLISKSRPLSPISALTTPARQLSPPPPFQRESSNLSNQLSTKTHKSSANKNEKTEIKEKENKSNDNELNNLILNLDKKNNLDKERKTKSNQALNDNEKNLNNLDELNNQNLIRILSENIIELTDNLNSFLNEHNNELNKKMKSSETKKDNNLIEKLDQLREVSEKLKDCTTNVNSNKFNNKSNCNLNNQNIDLIDQIKQNNLNEQTKLADQFNIVEQIDLVNNLNCTDNIEPEYAECKSIIDFNDLNQTKVQVNQQLIIQSPIEQQNEKQHNYEIDENQFNDQNKDKKIKQINKQQLKQDKLELERKIEQQNEESSSQEEDEFFECSNDEQKNLKKSLFKGSKLDLDQVISRAIEEQLLGQWLKLSDSLDSEDAPVQEKHSIDDLKHKFATKLAIIHYKLYQKYSKNKPIKNGSKAWRHRKLQKYNKIQSKYTLLNKMMDDDQFIQFLMDKINYFMRKLRQCKTKKKEIKKTQNLNSSTESLKEERKLKQQFEFDKGSLKDETIEEAINKLIDENNNETILDKNIQMILDENNNNQLIETDKLDQLINDDENNNEFLINESKLNQLIDNDQNIQEELNKLNEIKNELNGDGFINQLNDEIMKDLDEKLKPNNDLEEIKIERTGLSKYTLLFIFTLVIFMILIVLFRSFSLFSFSSNQIKKGCTNCARNNLDTNQLVLKPVDTLNQFRQQIKFPPCDQRIIAESYKLLGKK